MVSLLKGLLRKKHTIEKSIQVYLESIPGYNYRLHSLSTVKSYERSLLSNPHNFLAYMKLERIVYLHQLNSGILESYKSYVLNKVDARSAMKDITAVRQMLRYAHKLGWVPESLGIDFKLPKPKIKKKVENISPEIIELLENGNWGYNDFTRSRNKLIVHLFTRRGLHPMEIPKILLEHIERHKDLFVISLEGKKGRWRETMLDEKSSQALRDYAPHRGAFLDSKNVFCEHLIINSAPQEKGSWKMGTPGISAIIRQMKRKMQREGCLNIRNLCPNTLRQTAETRDWENSLNLNVRNAEMGIQAQYGNSKVALKQYIQNSRRNAYILSKGSSLVERFKAGDNKAGEELRDLKIQYPESDMRPPTLLES